MTEYHSLEVQAVRHETDDAVSIELAVPDALRDVFAFRAGQFLNVRAYLDGEELRRSYSICASPNEHVLRVAVKKVPGGKFSTWANEILSPGDTIEAMPPQGKFTVSCDAGQSAAYVFFAAGSGITPVISLIKWILETEHDSDVVLFYGNRSLDSIIFREDLEGLKNIYLGRFSVHHVLSRERQSSDLFNGRIDVDKCETYSRVFFSIPDVRKFFICGPESMINGLRSWLQAKGVDRDRIGFELFTTGIEQKRARAVQDVEVDRSGESLVTVRIDGTAMDFSLPYSGKNVLDAAVAHGADAPFSCKGGVCCTCKALLLEGEVEMDVVYGLEPDEIEDGYILTCQSHPRSERLVVDFDIR